VLLKRWSSVFTWLGVSWILFASFLPDRFGAAVFAALNTLVLAPLAWLALVARRQQARSITQMLRELEAEPAPVVAAPPAGAGR
jgi:hypothetical protein